MPKAKKYNIYQKKPVVQLTQEGLDKARVDQERLQTEREEVLVRLQTAREMGDLSENGAYKAARFELSNIDRQLRHLQYVLKFGQVVEKSSDGTVSFGNTVILKNNSKTFEFILVSDLESNPAQKKLSDKSPIGQAVIGKKVGDTALVHTPSGEIEYTIESIK